MIDIIGAWEGFTQCLTQGAGHVDLNGIAYILFLLTLGPYEFVLLGESLYFFKFIHTKHAHLNINYPIQCHELFYLLHNSAVVGVDRNEQSLFGLNDGAY